MVLMHIATHKVSYFCAVIVLLFVVAVAAAASIVN